MAKKKNPTISQVKAPTIQWKRKTGKQEKLLDQWVCKQW